VSCAFIFAFATPGNGQRSDEVATPAASRVPGYVKGMATVTADDAR